MRIAWIALFAALLVWGQAPRLPRSGPLGGPEGRAARIEGKVVADRNGLPLRRVQVILKPLEAGIPTLAAQTDDQGVFELRDVPPGPYEIEARRDGYLTTSTYRRSGQRMPPRFTLGRAQVLDNLVFRLRPWSVLSGRVRYEDGEPAIGIRVELYRRYHLRGRQGFAAVAAAVTNDRGEFRAHGLPAGSYYVAANLERGTPGPEVKPQPRLDQSGYEIPVPSYATTFYPNSTKLLDALPVQVKEGDDLSGIDIFLSPVERRRLSGHIIDGTSGTVITAAAITLQRLDGANNGTLPVPIQLEFDRDDDEFHLDDVAPGYYQLWIDASANNQRLLGRTLVNVTNADIGNMELVALPARPWSGVVTTVTGADPLDPLSTLRVQLEPRSERGAIIAVATPAGKPFDVAIAPQETYDVFVEGLPDKYFISSVRAGGLDVRTSGLSGDVANNLPFEIVVDSRGGRIDGAVAGPGETSSGFGNVAWPGATVELIPDPPRDRLQSYRETFADEAGIFKLEGIPPGRYILAAWYDEPTCDIYDEVDLSRCRIAGTTIEVTPSSRQQTVIEVKPLAGR